MNGKFSQVIGMRGSHYQHNRFSTSTWKIVVDRFKLEFPNSTKRLEYFRTFQNALKMVASFLGKESSPIFAQRAFRGYRILQLHSKLWSFNKHPVSKRALLSFVLFSLCQANNTLKKRIEDAELIEHLKDLEFIHELTAATVVCPNCKDRLVVDKKVAGVKYCHCPDTTLAPNRKIEGYPWTPFVETPDLLIWRQPHPDHPGLYVYKVYGYYDDISAEDFLDVQLDMDYRKKWDDTALKLDVVERDVGTNAEVIYWEMNWPRMFSNRDYLFVRRHKLDKGSNNIIIMSKAITHPKVPERKGVHRVTEYWSVMQIKATRGLSQPGVEFGLTYYDNPGVSLPQWLTNWAAMTGIPEFLDKQRIAARLRRQQKSKISIGISSQSHYSDKKSHQAISPSAGQSTPNETHNEESKSSDNCNTSNNNTNLNASSTPTSQEGKTELLSQFFKEQILDVHS